MNGSARDQIQATNEQKQAWRVSGIRDYFTKIY